MGHEGCVVGPLVRSSSSLIAEQSKCANGSVKLGCSKQRSKDLITTTSSRVVISCCNSNDAPPVRKSHRLNDGLKKRASRPLEQIKTIKEDSSLWDAPVLTPQHGKPAQTWTHIPQCPKTAPSGPMSRLLNRTAPVSNYKRSFSASYRPDGSEVSPRTRRAYLAPRLAPLEMAGGLKPAPPPSSQSLKTPSWRRGEAMKDMSAVFSLLLQRTPSSSADTSRILAASCSTLREMVGAARASRSVPPAFKSLPHCDLRGSESSSRSKIPVLSTVLCTVIGVDGRLLSAGSGVITRDAHGGIHVLTAAHVVVSQKQVFNAATDPPGVTTVLIAINQSVMHAPRHVYRATTRPELVNVPRDIAVLTLTESVETNPSCGIMDDRGRLVPTIRILSSMPAERFGGLHALELGEVSQVELNDHLMLYGFPRTGSETITTSEASCCGFVAQNGVVDHLKLHGQIDNGFSGSPVVSMRDGRLVGIMSYSKGRVDYAVPIEAAAPLMDAAAGRA